MIRNGTTPTVTLIVTAYTRPSSAHLKGFEDLISKFQATSVSLERSYRQLQDRVRELSAELDEEREQRIRFERLAAMGELAMELAHEIRNPLGSIELYASMIKGPHADQIVRGVQLLNHSVTNMLHFGQPIHPRPEEIAVDNLVEGVRDFLTPLADQKGIRISSSVEAGCRGVGDYELLHRMLLNLVLNALRETPSGGSIRLEAKKLSGQFRLVVEDDGPGIPPQIVAKIFDPMFSTSKSGRGLGLPIVKRIVEAHLGSISVESSDRGTRFEILFRTPRTGTSRVKRNHYRPHHRVAPTVAAARSAAV